MRLVAGVIGGLLVVAALLVVTVEPPLAGDQRCEEGGLGLGPTARFRLTSTGSAVIVPWAAIGRPRDYDLRAEGCGADYSQRELTVHDASGNEKALFAGISHPADLARYLGTTRRDRARLLFTEDSYDGATRHVAEGTQRAGLVRQSDVDFWHAQAHFPRGLGPSDQTLTYGYPEAGSFALMISNENGSPGIEAHVWVFVDLVKPARFDWAESAIAAVLLVIGLGLYAQALSRLAAA